jgi:hypothetical protein
MARGATGLSFPSSKCPANFAERSNAYRAFVRCLGATAMATMGCSKPQDAGAAVDRENSPYSFL